MRTTSRLALGLATLAFLAGCSETGDVLAPSLLSTPGPEIGAPTAANFELGTATYTEVWDGRGTDSERCEYVGQEGRPATGWIHWIFATKGGSTDARLTVNGTTTYGPGAPLNAETWHFYTPFYDLDGLEAEIQLFGGSAGPGGGLVISDYCPGVAKSLEVEKTALTKFTRTHKWDIDKKVETEWEHVLNGYPKIWLYTDGSGDETATWTVDVTYEGYLDSGFVIYGDITIKNISAAQEAKTVTSIVDDLGLAGYDDVAVSCTDGGGAEFNQGDLPRSIAFDETWSCSYWAGLVDGDAEAGDSGTNVVSVMVDGEDDAYEASAGWSFDAPTTENYKTVNVEDVSDLFGTKNLGSVTAPYGDTFTYTKDFAWKDYGADKCGSYAYGNTAKIKETGQTSSATLKVNVQCFIDETAFAKGDGPGTAAKTVADFCTNGFNRWGWTNKIAAGTYEWTMWAGAGQCDTAKGTDVGTVEVTYGADGSFSAIITLKAGYALLEQHDYAGSHMFPQQQQGRRTVDTVAPGQYYVQGNLSGDIWTIIHAVVGMPDPNFGP